MKSFYQLLISGCVLVLSHSCSSSCDEAGKKLSEQEVDIRGTEYFADINNKAKCEAYASSIKAYIEDMKNCKEDDAIIKSYQNSLDALDCE